MALAFPGQSGKIVEKLATDAFVDLFGDRALRKQVLQWSPAMLAEALTWAIRIEAIDESGTPEVAISYDKDGHRLDKKPARASAVEGAFQAQETTAVRSAHDIDVRQLAAELQACRMDLWRNITRGAPQNPA